MAQPTRERFGRYELVSKLGRGGMAETWRARLLGAAGVTKPVLIKKVLAEYANDDSFVTMFISEAHISATLSHGNIAQVFDFGRVDGEFFLAMEFVEGQPLHRVLKRALRSGLSGIPVPIATFIALEMCRGLHYAHTRRDDKGVPLGIVHRDISPDNVLLSYEGQVKIVDFGIAKARALRGFQTEPGVVKGKYLFFSPEQARGKEVDARTDVWATGVVLYEMLCGQLPVSGPSYTALPRLVGGEFPSPRQLRPELPEELNHIVMRALAVDVQQRFESSHAFGDALAGFLYSSAPRFSSMSVSYLLQELFREDLRSEGREVHVPASFVEELSLWRANGTGQGSGESPVPPQTPGQPDPSMTPTGEEPVVRPAQHRWLVPALLAGTGLLGVLAFAALNSDVPPLPPGALQPQPLRAASEAPKRQASADTPSPVRSPSDPETHRSTETRGSAVYPVSTIFLDARRDIIPVPSSATRLRLNPGGSYRFSEQSAPAGAPPVFFWLKSPAAGAKGLEGVLSRTPVQVEGGGEALFFVFESMDDGRERWVRMDDARTGERSTVLLDEQGPAALDRTFELKGLDVTTLYQLMLLPQNNWARTRGSTSDVVQSVVCVGSTSAGGTSRSTAYLVSTGTTTDVQGVSTLRCGFLDDDPSDNQGSMGMSILHRSMENAKDLYAEGRQLLIQRNYNMAETSFKKCIAANPRYADCYMMLGSTLARLGRFDEAALHYQDFLTLNPRHPNAPRVKQLLEQYRNAKP